MSRDTDRSKKDSSSRLRMDSNLPSRYHGENSRKHKELDNVMRKARESQSNYWNKKILEVEEKDPHRWRHSGYKEMYVKGASSESSKINSKSSTRCRSPRRRNSRPRSPRSQSPRSPKNCRNRSNSPKTYNSKNRSSRSPRRRSPRNVNPYNSRPRSPPFRRSNSSKSRSPKQKKLANSKIKTSQNQYHCNQDKERKSPSSNSTCSDQSCSVCSPKSFEDRRRRINTSKSHSRSNSTSSVRLPANGNEGISTSSKSHLSRAQKRCSSPFTQTTSPSKTRSSSYYTEEYYKAKKLKIQKEKKNSQPVHEETHIPEPMKMMRKHIKVENVRVNPSDGRNSHIPAESSPSDDSDSSSTNSHTAPPKMTLSERFGKMAQWSVDRRVTENMRITKIGDNPMKVVFEGEDRIPGYDSLGYDSLTPGYYPDSLLSQGPRGLDSWDDVRVRYDYYKSRGYLRDLTLDDYLKWEEWWYKYQDWLEAERYYEQWTAQSTHRPSGNRKRRRRNNNH